MAVSLVSTGVTFPDSSTQTTAATGFGFKNKILNGSMVIDQRNAGAEVNPAVNNSYYLDRWSVLSTQTSKFKIGQNAGAVTPPVGYTNYLGITSLSAYSVTSSDVFEVRQNIEGLNVSDLAWGTASAATVTVSFWVRSSLTGTFGGALQNSGYNYCYPFTFSINSANTWEQKTVTVAGPTSGTWLTTNGTGLRVAFNLGTGSTYSGTAGAWAATEYHSATGATSVVGTNGATFYITGVQLEKGSTATSFDYRPYGTELQLAQRYYWQFPVGVGAYYGSGYCRSAARIDWIVNNPVPMRAAPTLNAVNGTSYFVCEFGGSGSDFFDAVLLNSASVNTVSMYATSGVSVTSASGCLVSSSNASAVVGYSSEL
jgi:hypothetical protein